VVEALVRLALEAGASDLHLRPGPQGVEVLLRCDGVLQHRFDLPSEIYERLLVGLKNMARLASYKRSVPQDGRLVVADTEVRVATTPTHFGEKAVLRLVRPQRRLLELDELGFSPEEIGRLQRIVDQPQGLVLATGPAGSGKTTTLFAAMSWLYARHRQRLEPAPGAALNVVTLEDPIECIVPEFTQTQIHPQMGLTFASGLRSLLRQDPEVILVGEIRDPETAAAAVQCSLTGHLVLSTLHARDSLGVIPRLLEMGVEAYLLSASLAGVLYQRLLRRLCTRCRRPCPPAPSLVSERALWGLPEAPCWAPAGCPACQGTGYSGRSAVPELLEVDEDLRQGILDRRPLAELRRQAGERGLAPLRRAALLRVAEGVTSYEEVCRVVPGPRP
jgi:type II secretory ATPase GspE/PulE/Tfp pilus assembly ATPase PilB-like protein